MRIVLKPEGDIQIAGGDVGRYAVNQWIKFRIDADAVGGEFSISVDGAMAGKFKFADSTKLLDRVVFRTGEYRLLPIWGDEVPAGSDRPTESSEYVMRDLKLTDNSK